MAGDSFLTAEAFLWRESELRSSTLDKRDAFTSTNTRRHFNEGCVRRHDMRQSSRLFLSHHRSAGVLKDQTFLIGPSAITCAMMEPYSRSAAGHPGPHWIAARAMHFWLSSHIKKTRRHLSSVCAPMNTALPS
jgi:hypothetical protein